MVAMANKSSHHTALLQYAWQLQVYHSEYFHNDMSWSIQHQTISFVKHQVFIIYPHKNSTQTFAYHMEMVSLYITILLSIIKYFLSN